VKDSAEEGTRGQQNGSSEQPSLPLKSHAIHAVVSEEQAHDLVFNDVHSP